MRRRPKRPKPPPLDEDLILSWADAYFERTGEWPKGSSGPIPESSGDNWNRVNKALYHGYRGLLTGSSLALLLKERRGKLHPRYRPELTIEQILSWADAYFERNGTWPKENSGQIPERKGEHWRKVGRALNEGIRGLPPGSSLPRLLQERRSVAYTLAPPKLTVQQILIWADSYFEREGVWPKQKSGVIPERPKETWFNVHIALYLGLRGLEPGSSLARLLRDKRGVFNSNIQPELTLEQILEWADLHKMRHGKYPNCKEGAVDDAPHETWTRIDDALRVGYRGFSKGSSLAIVLLEHRGREHYGQLPAHSEEQILSWADAHYARTGRWPTEDSGPIQDAPRETWYGISMALSQGYRGLSGGSSLAKLLAIHRGKRNHLDLPTVSEDQITEWLRAHMRRHGKYPAMYSGVVEDADGENWDSINRALRLGLRGLPGGSSLAKLKASLKNN